MTSKIDLEAIWETSPCRTGSTFALENIPLRALWLLMMDCTWDPDVFSSKVGAIFPVDAVRSHYTVPFSEGMLFSKIF